MFENVNNVNSVPLAKATLKFLKEEISNGMYFGTFKSAVYWYREELNGTGVAVNQKTINKIFFLFLKAKRTTTTSKGDSDRKNVIRFPDDSTKKIEEFLTL